MVLLLCNNPLDCAGLLSRERRGEERRDSVLLALSAGEMNSSSFENWKCKVPLHPPVVQTSSHEKIPVLRPQNLSSRTRQVPSVLVSTDRHVHPGTPNAMPSGPRTEHVSPACPGGERGVPS